MRRQSGALALLALVAASCLDVDAVPSLSTLDQPGKCCNAGCKNCMSPQAKPFCTQSQTNCETHCNSHWCTNGPPPPPPGPPGPPGTFAFTVNTSMVIATVDKKFVSFTIDQYVT